MEKISYIIGDVSLEVGEQSFGYSVTIYRDSHGICECSVKKGSVYRDNHGYFLQLDHQAAAVSGEYIKFKGNVAGVSQGKILDRALKEFWGI